MMNRRQFMTSTIAGAVTSGLAVSAAEPRVRTELGIADFSYSIRNRAERSGAMPKTLDDPLKFLTHCHRIGAGGMQMGVGRRDRAYIAKLREYAEANGLFIEGSTSLPRDDEDVRRFEGDLATAKETGAKVVRIAIGGRRYEQFERADQFKAFAERSWRSIRLAEPAAARQGVRLAVENHKDWRIEQMIAMLKELDSKYVGVCVDTGNSVALLEDPMEVVEAYAPWAHSVHLKDLAVREHEEGFLLADVVLGEGLLDLPKMVDVLRRAKPEVRFSLEMATRDPLKVPCLTEKYWATLESVSGHDLARALRYVRARQGPENTLPKVSTLPLQEQVRLEEENIHKCLRYASQYLHL